MHFTSVLAFWKALEKCMFKLYVTLLHYVENGMIYFEYTVIILWDHDYVQKYVK